MLRGERDKDWPQLAPRGERCRPVNINQTGCTIRSYDFFFALNLVSVISALCDRDCIGVAGSVNTYAPRLYQQENRFASRVYVRVCARRVLFFSSVLQCGRSISVREYRVCVSRFNALFSSPFVRLIFNLHLEESITSTYTQGEERVFATSSISSGSPAV